MGLRDQAKRDARYIISGDVYGFRWPVTVEDPSGVVSVALYCTSRDISLMIDPQTGQALSGRTVSCTFHIDDLIDQGFVGLPVSVKDGGAPWKVKFDDVNGFSYTFIVSEGIPDRTFGVIACMLELYDEVA